MMMKRQLSSSPPPHQFSWPWLPREYPALGFVCATHAHSHSYFFLLHWLLRHLGGGVSSSAISIFKAAPAYELH